MGPGGPGMMGPGGSMGPGPGGMVGPSGMGPSGMGPGMMGPGSMGGMGGPNPEMMKAKMEEEARLRAAQQSRFRMGNPNMYPGMQMGGMRPGMTQQQMMMHMRMRMQHHQSMMQHRNMSPDMGQYPPGSAPNMEMMAGGPNGMMYGGGMQRGMMG